jgi:hypothetical protein
MAAKKKAQPKKKRLTAKQSRERWAAAALCLGYNELTKLGKTLGEKMYSRLNRRAAEEYFMALGGTRIFQEDPPVVVLTTDDGLPFIELRAQDIELMRAAVAAHDATQCMSNDSEVKRG